jgi:hypothetical protein
MTRASTTGPRKARRAARQAVFTLFAAGALLAGLISGAPSPAAAQTVCAEHAEVVKELGARHAETPIALGLAANGGVIEVFSTGDGSTWTMVITMPDGMTCMMAAGESWETLPANVPGSQV